MEAKFLMWPDTSTVDTKILTKLVAQGFKYFRYVVDGSDNYILCVTKEEIDDDQAKEIWDSDEMEVFYK